MTDQATAAACVETAELLAHIARDVRGGADRLAKQLQRPHRTAEPL